MSEGSPRATVLDFEEAMNDIFVHVTKIKQLHQVQLQAQKRSIGKLYLYG